MEDVDALTTILATLKQLDTETQKRVLQSVMSFLNIADAGGADRSSMAPYPTVAGSSDAASGTFGVDRSMSPKEFMRQKQPASDVEKVACLAYYLAHYRDTPHFTTIDVSGLNTEAALPKFSNASFSINNAMTSGYLVAAAKGTKQISASGERFVELLPDRDAAREAFKSFRPRRSGKKNSLKV